MLSPVKIWRNQKKVSALLGLEGKVISYTEIHVPPEGFKNQAPYVVALVKLRNGRGVVAQLVDYEPHQLVIGQKVKTVLRRTRDAGEEGVIPYGIKFKPIR